jgi:hypothetical protein
MMRYVGGLYEHENSTVSNNRQSKYKRSLEPKKKEVARGWRTLHNEQLHKLYASPCIIRAIKSKRMRWEGYAAWMGVVKNAYKI